MSALVVAAGLALWVGAALVLSEVRWFSRASLVARLRPYAAAPQPAERDGFLTAHSVREVLGPMCQAAGERLARLFGGAEELAVRLERIHSRLDVGAFRVRQFGWVTAGFGAGAAAAAALAPPPAAGLLFVAGAPLLAFLVVEHRLASASARRQRRLFLELPVVCEQLATLLSAGYSLGAALARLSQRGQGACAEDLTRVCSRIRQGLSEVEALREWAGVAGVAAVDRLVAVLSLNRQAGDLARLVSDEARSIRRDAHRSLVETLDRRGQQVWIPVTVATLVPGVIFLSIPFIEALRLFAGP